MQHDVQKDIAEELLSGAVLWDMTLYMAGFGDRQIRERVFEHMVGWPSVFGCQPEVNGAASC